MRTEEHEAEEIEYVKSMRNGRSKSGFFALFASLAVKAFVFKEN